MIFQTYRAGDVVRFQAYTQEAAEMDYATGTVIAERTDVPLCGQWVDIAFGELTRRGVATARLELVRRAPKDVYDDRFTEDPNEIDRLREGLRH